MEEEKQERREREQIWEERRAREDKIWRDTRVAVITGKKKRREGLEDSEKIIILLLMSVGALGFGTLCWIW
jgi:hypothetical protein